jgi:hypothetical protein
MGETMPTIAHPVEPQFFLNATNREMPSQQGGLTRAVADKHATYGAKAASHWKK